MVKPIAVCILTNNLYFETRYVIENLIAKTKCKIRLYIFDNASTDQRIIEYCHNLCKETKGYFKALPKVESISEATNKMIKIIDQENCVLFPVNCLVNNNWLEDLLFYSKNIDNLGCISIRNTFEKVHLMPILHKTTSKPEDELKNIYITENNSVEGLMFFKRSIIDQIGLMDERLQYPGCDYLELCFRFSAHGYHNIYIRNQTLIKLNLDNQIIFPTKTKESVEELKQQIEIMYKNQKFKK